MQAGQLSQYRSEASRLREALANDPSDCASWICLGYVCTWLHDFDEAEEAFAHGIETARDDGSYLGWLYRYRGHLWMARGDKRRALADYERSCEQGSEYLNGAGDPEESFVYAAEVHEELGDYQRAMQALEAFCIYRTVSAVDSDIGRLQALIAAKR